MLRLVSGVGYLFTGAVLWMAPYLSRREYFFAVRVPEGFRGSPEARRAVSQFRTVLVAAVIVGLCAHLALPARMLPGASPVVSLATILTAGLAFFRQHRSLKSFAAPAVSTRQVELIYEPERLPWFAWLGFAPPVLIAAVALLFHAEMRAVRGAFEALIFAGELSAYLAVAGLATWYGSRRGPMRRIVLGMLISAEYLQGVAFSAPALVLLLRFPVWMAMAIPFGFLIPMIIAITRAANQPREAPDPTPDECWKGDMFYYNPNDAALFVETRVGFGLACNFASPWVWALLAALALLVASSFFVFALP